MKRTTIYILACLLSLGMLQAQTTSKSRVKGTLYVAPNGKLTFHGRATVTPEGEINNTSVLNAKGGLLLQSEDTKDASGNDAILRNTGTLTLDANQTIEVKKTFKGNVWTYFSMPFDVEFANMTIEGESGLQHNRLFKTIWYDAQERANSGGKGGSIWKDTHTKLSAGVGYSMGLNNTYAASKGGSVDISFLGTPSTGSATVFNANAIVPVAYKFNTSYFTDISFGWHYLGNPFASNFKIDATSVTGYSGAIYIHTNGRVDDSNDGFLSDGFHAYAVSEGKIVAPYAGIFIKIPSTQKTLTSITFNRSGQTGKNLAVLRSSVPAEEDNLKILLRNSSRCYDYCRIFISDNYIPGYNEEEDFTKMYPDDDSFPQFWSLSEKFPMDVNRITTEESQMVPLGVKLPQEDTYTITIASDGVKGNFESVQLFDKQENKQINLLTDSYVFTSEALETEDRFFLMVAKQETSVNDEMAQSPVIIYSNSSTIYVKNLFANSLVQMYTTSGTQVFSGKSDDQLSVVLPAGNIYIVKVVTGEESQTFKVVNK